MVLSRTCETSRLRNRPLRNGIISERRLLWARVCLYWWQQMEVLWLYTNSNNNNDDSCRRQVEKPSLKVLGAHTKHEWTVFLLHFQWLKQLWCFHSQWFERVSVCKCVFSHVTVNYVVIDTDEYCEWRDFSNQKFFICVWEKWFFFLSHFSRISWKTSSIFFIVRDQCWNEAKTSSFLICCLFLIPIFRLKTWICHW